MKKLAITLAIFLTLGAGAAEYSQQDAQRFSAYYSNGMQFLKNQQYSSAIVEFKKVLRFSPYDSTIQDALANAYFARAQYYRQTTKEVKKALNDYKSAYFYAKYWSKISNNSMASLANSAKSDINSLEGRLQIGLNPQSRFQNAKILRAQGELAASGYDFQELKNTQYKIDAYENLGNIYKNLNNLVLAMDYMKEAIDLNPKNAKLHFLYGVMLDEAKNYEASIEQYNLALQYGDKSPELLEILENKWTQNIVNNPNDAQGYINLGAIYQKQGNLELARAQYLKATQMNPDDPIGFYNLASLYIEQKNYQAAVDVYDKLLLKNPQNKEALKYKEDIILNHFSGEKLQKYIAQKAISSPKNYEAQFNYALELHKNKNYTSAIEYYKKALLLDPSKEECYLNLAQIYIEQKNFNSAAQICEKGLLILPNNEKLISLKNDAKNYQTGLAFDSATKLFEQKNYKEALGAYLKINPQTKDVKMAIASCYWQMNDYKNANKYYLEILALDPSNLEALVNSAYAYYSMNDFTNAKLGANKILAFDKTNKEALEILSSIEQSESSSLLQNAIDEYEKGNFQNSLNLASKILSQNPNDEYALYYKGLCQDELKKGADAAKTYKTLILKHPNFAPAYYSLGVNLDNSAKYAEAVSNYEKFLSLKGSEKDDMTAFCENRIKELKDYLSQLNGTK